MAIDDRNIAAALRRLRGQYCTPPGVSSAQVREVIDRGLARFHEWPSGHWSITEAGREFLADTEGR